MIHRHGACRELLAEQFRQACGLGAFSRSRRSVEQQARAVAEPESHIEAREREPFDQPDDMAQLGRITAHELAPRGHVEEQLAYFDASALRMGGGANRRNRSSVDAYLRT